jgi:hypothetical protein
MKPIKDYETYAVSPEGEVLDLRTKKLMKQYPNKDAGDYLQVSLINENGYKSFRVHRLVGETFLPNPDNLPELDHIDRNRQNNNVENLRWVSHSDNQINKLFTTSKYPKCIHLEDVKTKKNPNPSWRIMIRNIKCKYSKRFQYADYTLEQIIEIRNEVFRQHNIPIID